MVRRRWLERPHALKMESLLFLVPRMYKGLACLHWWIFSSRLLLFIVFIRLDVSFCLPRYYFYSLLLPANIKFLPNFEHNMIVSCALESRRVGYLQ